MLLRSTKSFQYNFRSYVLSTSNILFTYNNATIYKPLYHPQLDDLYHQIMNTQNRDETYAKTHKMLLLRLNLI